MTVQYKTTVTIPPPGPVEFNEQTIESVYKSFFQQPKQKKFPVYQHLYFASYYLSHGGKKTDWQKYDTHSSSVELGNSLFEDLKSYMETRRKSESWDGYKIVCVSMDVLNWDIQPVVQYCMEYIKPVEKVYINGPKKTKDPFLAKKGGQYSKAI